MKMLFKKIISFFVSFKSANYYEKCVKISHYDGELVNFHFYYARLIYFEAYIILKDKIYILVIYLCMLLAACKF